jgi:hypothetical protein
MQVNELMAQYNEDPNIKQKIIEGFHRLTNNFQFNMEKRNRLKFNSKFNEFSVKTHGLLFIR